MAETHAADLPRSPHRFVAFALIAVTILVALTARLFQLQVIDGGRYAAQAAAAQQVEVPVPSVRGLIRDREGRLLAINVPRWVVTVTPADVPAVAACLASAFFEDPLWGKWTFPDERTRARDIESFMRFWAATAVRDPWVRMTDGGEAVAIWHPPGETQNL